MASQSYESNSDASFSQPHVEQNKSFSTLLRLTARCSVSMMCRESFMHTVLYRVSLNFPPPLLIFHLLMEIDRFAFGKICLTKKEEFF